METTTNNNNVYSRKPKLLWMRSTRIHFGKCINVNGGTWNMGGMVSVAHAILTCCDLPVRKLINQLIAVWSKPIWWLMKPMLWLYYTNYDWVWKNLRTNEMDPVWNEQMKRLSFTLLAKLLTPCKKALIFFSEKIILEKNHKLRRICFLYIFFFVLAS